MNYFIEGLQGSGKTTLAEKLSRMHPDYKLYREGDYSPIELAWCALVSKEEYEKLLERYGSLSLQIKENTFQEGDDRIVCYTRIRTQDRRFYQDLEKHEIYNGRAPLSKLEETVLKRHGNYQGKDAIFECSLFQNIVEDMILFHDQTDEQILSFFRKLSKTLEDRQMKILYLKSEDIPGNISQVRKERTDGQGRQVWFELLCDYFDHSPYALKTGSSGEKELMEHLKHRQDLELRICEEVFADRSLILRSKDYDPEKEGIWNS